VGKYEKLYQHILERRSDANVPFSELCQLMKQLGFRERIKGDHHIFTKEDVEEILNLQPKGSKAKPYQVKQVRNVILNFRLTLGE
jgi:predicted RNA binding protein YcfA (HicA-like mRNA interferase family)